MIITGSELKQLMDSGQSFALFDIREPAEYNSGHIPGATSLPRRDIEFRIASLVPVRSTPIIAAGGSDQRASLAAITLRRVGYENILELEGGLPSWVESGGTKTSGVNVPSKEFGERIHAHEAVQEIEPEQLHKMMTEGQRFVVLDVRTPQEYRRFCIPGGLNVSGGDLILQLADLKRDPSAKVVINCAGRTRSIIGTQTLRRLGVHHALALKNGTMGWVLAGYELEQKPARGTLLPSPVSRAEAEREAARIAQEENVSMISAFELQGLLARRTISTLYAIDVRSEEEYSAGHIPGFLWIPGGQAIQRADDFVPLRSGTIVFACDGIARSVVVAYWYRRMGLENVHALAGGIQAWMASGLTLEKGEPPKGVLGLEEAKKLVEAIAPDELSASMRHGEQLTILDVSLSSEYESGHLPGACWIPRGWLELKISEIFPGRDWAVAVTCPDGEQATFAAATLLELGYRRVSVLEGGVQSWRRQGNPLETGLTRALVEPQDVVLSASLTGDKEAMRRYLEWEIALSKKYERSN